MKNILCTCVKFVVAVELCSVDTLKFVQDISMSCLREGHKFVGTKFDPVLYLFFYSVDLIIFFNNQQ